MYVFIYKHHFTKYFYFSYYDPEGWYGEGGGSGGFRMVNMCIPVVDSC